MNAVHYWWEGALWAGIACGSRRAVEGTQDRDKVTCLKCRKTWRFKTNGVVPRGH